MKNYLKNLKLLFVFLFACVVISTESNATGIVLSTATYLPDTAQQFYIIAKPAVKNAIFKKNEIGYSVKLNNQYKEAQDGKLVCYVTDFDDRNVYTDSVKVHINRNSQNDYPFKITVKDPNFYKVSFRLNLTDYDDTVHRVFGYKPELITAQPHKPADFKEFWANTKNELKAIAPQYKITEEKALSVNNRKVYLVEMHSWGNAVIRGWLTIPNNRPKKIPVKYRVPGYIVNMVPSMDDDDFAVFNINVRGGGNSADAIDTHGEYNLYNLGSRDDYVYRAVYMDCVRGLDFICAHADMGLDTSKIAVDGASQGGCLGVALAGLDNRVKLLSTQLPLYADFRDAFRIVALQNSAATTLGKITNFSRSHPGYYPEKIFAVWDYYDPLNFAPDVKCPVIMGIGLLDEFCPPQCSFAMFNRFTNKRKDYFISPEKTHELDDLYYTYQYNWFDENFRLK